MASLQQAKDAYYGVKPADTNGGPPRWVDRHGKQPPVHFSDREAFLNFCREITELTGSGLAVRLTNRNGEYRNDLSPEEIIDKLGRNPLMLALTLDSSQDSILLDNRENAQTTISVQRRSDMAEERAREHLLANLLYQHTVPIPPWKRRLNVPVVASESRERVIDRHRANVIRWQSWVGGAVFGLLASAIKGWLHL